MIFDIISEATMIVLLLGMFCRGAVFWVGVTHVFMDDDYTADLRTLVAFLLGWILMIPFVALVLYWIL